MDFERKQLPHRPPDWVKDGSAFFITVCLEERGSRLLVDPKVASAIRDAAAFYQTKGIWWVELFVLVPDHMHALISFNQRERGMSQTMQAWKRFLNRQQGIQWQRGYFDHRLRSENALREKAAYIRNNPVRAGLVTEISDWPFIWTNDDLR